MNHLTTSDDPDAVARRIDREAHALHEHLSGAGLSLDVCRRLAALEDEIGTNSSTAILAAEVAFNAAILEDAGLDPASAAVTADAMTRVDLGRVLVGSRIVSDVLSTNRNTVRENRLNGRLPARIEQESHGRAEIVAWTVGRVLATLVFRRHNPRNARYEHEFPPPAPYPTGGRATTG